MATLEQRLYLGDRAKEILENEAFVAAFDAIEAEVIETWRTSPARDAEGREKCWQYLTLLAKVRTHLQSSLESGKLAALDLKHQRTIMDRLKDGIRL
jgi:hypothetical protein